MGILTVMCYEQAGLFEYFSASGSQAGCSFVKALYCISFLCQSPFSCGGAVSNDDPQLPASRMETGLPRALGPHRQPLNNLRASALSVCLLSSHSPPCPHFSLPPRSLLLPPFNACLFYFTLISFILLPLLQYFLIRHLLYVLLLHISLCPHLFSSLHPFFPPPFVLLSRSEEGLSGVSCASCRSRPHLVRGISATVSDALQKQGDMHAHVSI